MRRTLRTAMTMIVGFAVAATLAGPALAAAPPGAVPASAACAKVSVSATPKLNTQAGRTETLRTTVTSCAAKIETVRIRQRLSLPGAFSGTFVLPRGTSVDITQHIPYRCCGSYDVTDRVYSGSGRLLDTARAGWTFA